MYNHASDDKTEVMPVIAEFVAQVATRWLLGHGLKIAVLLVSMAIRLITQRVLRERCISTNVTKESDIC